MSALSVAIVTPSAITIKWTNLPTSLNGGDPPIFYSVEGSTDKVAWTVLNNGGAFGLNYT
jgi:hypothetical protein